MFETHFGLRENPFASGHQSRFVYPSREHQEALAHLRYGIENHEPFVLITGEVGTGKTTALFEALAELQSRVSVALIINSALTRGELLEEICLRFGVVFGALASKPQAMAQLEQHLLALRGRGERAILLLDEAQNFERELLEEIRLLSNLEAGGEKLMQIILVGQPELESKLSRPELRQLRQRIGVHYRLRPLNLEETQHYIQHRVTVAGGDATRIFPREACAEVHAVTNGIPREINQIGSQALLDAFVDGAPSVDPRHVRSAANETAFQSVLPAAEADPRLPPMPSWPAAVPAPPFAPPPRFEDEVPPLPPELVAALPEPTPPLPATPPAPAPAPGAALARPAAPTAPTPSPEPPSSAADVSRWDTWVASLVKPPEETGAGAPPPAPRTTSPMAPLPPPGPPIRPQARPAPPSAPPEPLSERSARPMAEPPRKQEPVAEPPRRLEPVAEPPRKPEPVAEPPRRPEPVAEPPRKREPVAEPPRRPEQVVEPPRKHEAAGPARKQGPDRRAPAKAGTRYAAESALESPSGPNLRAGEDWRPPLWTPGGEPQRGQPQARLYDRMRAGEYEPRSNAGIKWLIGVAAIAVIAIAAVLTWRFGPWTKHPGAAPAPNIVALPGAPATVRGPADGRAAARTPAAAAMESTLAPSGAGPPETGKSNPATGANPPAAVYVPGVSTPPPGAATPSPALVRAPAAASRAPAVTQPTAIVRSAPITPPAGVEEFSISVATFLDRSRAQWELARVDSASNMTGRIVVLNQKGVTMFVVVMGAFRDRGAAERKASQMIARGTVDEARIMSRIVPAKP
jgi:type II secretory pathway predicted ATPase ExeA